MKRHIEEFGKDVDMKLNGKILANSRLSLAANNFASESVHYGLIHFYQITILQQGYNLLSRSGGHAATTRQFGASVHPTSSARDGQVYYC